MATTDTAEDSREGSAAVPSAVAAVGARRGWPAVRQPSGFAELHGAMLRLEDEFDLLSRSIGGVHYWPLVRATAFSVLMHRLFARRPWPASVREPLFLRGLRELPVTAAGLGAWRLWTRGAFDTVLCPFVRKHVRDGRVVDIHSEGMLQEEAWGRVLICDRHGAAGTYRSRSTRVISDGGGLRAVALFRAALTFPRLLPAAHAEHRLLDVASRRRLGIRWPLSAVNLAVRAAFFREDRRVMRELMRAKQVTRLVSVGYHGGAVAAALDLGVRCVELQHGVISPYDLLHHYPGRPDVPYSPQFFAVFGRYWAERIAFPRGTATVVVGSDNLYRAELRATAKVPHRVFVASQADVGARLFDAVVAAAGAAPEWEFVFRPHPTEHSANYRLRLSDLGCRAANLVLADPDDDVYRLLSSAEVQVGVYSTMLFEGMALGVRTIVLELPGWESIAPVIEMGDAVLARCASDIASLLPTAPRARDPGAYYAAPVTSVFSAVESASSPGLDLPGNA